MQAVVQQESTVFPILTLHNRRLTKGGIFTREMQGLCQPRPGLSMGNLSSPDFPHPAQWE